MAHPSLPRKPRKYPAPPVPGAAQLERLIAVLAVCTALAGCQSANLAPLHTASFVDLPRFMGDWYVISSIPTPFERRAFNAVESYRLNDDGSIATRFTYRVGAFDARERSMSPTGYVRDTQSNAVWDMQFIWPFKSDYRVMYVDDGYEVAMIGRTARDYLWIMARTPELSADTMRRLTELAIAEGYSLEKLREVPQRWPARISNAH